MDDLARYVAEIMRLRARVEELESLVGTKFQAPIEGLTPVGRAMLGLLQRHSIVPTEFALAAIYGNENPLTKYYAATIVSRLNKSLNKYNIVVKCDRANGYYLDAENKSRLARLVAYLNGPIESTSSRGGNSSRPVFTLRSRASTSTSSAYLVMATGHMAASGSNGISSDHS